MTLLRVALANPRAFLVGAGLGAILIGTGFILALLATGQTRAAPGAPSIVYACVNLYTGQTHLQLPGQPANCAAGEYPIALSSANPGANLAIVRRHYDHLLSGSGSGSAQQSCQAGERAISGGVGLKNAAGDSILSTDLVLNASEPLGEPAIGWRGAYDWTAALDGYIVEVSVFCLS